MNDELQALLNSYARYRESAVSGRYLPPQSVQQYLQQKKEVFTETLGRSVQGRPINLMRLGSGSTRVLLWSQMHGNESTSTKAVLDLINYFQQEPTDLLEACTLFIVPQLNPDGALAYTRLNANQVDLNRDAQALTQPESRILADLFQRVQPNYCFNLHGQRTLYSVGETRQSAVLSFLSPAADASRSVTLSRKQAMQLIAHMHTQLQDVLPGQIGRYDDSFNLNCVGDSFQAQGVPTLLFESGHVPDDYAREQSRHYTTLALISALHGLTQSSLKYTVADYEAIPENGKRFCDLIFRGLKTNEGSVDMAFQYEEVLEGGQIHFLPKLVQWGQDLPFYGHQEINGKEHSLSARDQELDWKIEMPLSDFSSPIFNTKTFSLIV
ncbi:M14 family zinc carboxypeptidase [Croceiramulus getboli]|nr:M14 family zinc carboxypeptidase [Flavobacteriaceae bacterium YJPT1-3]